jgi:RNA polymerase sigma-70 factor, ECF subfamily
MEAEDSEVARARAGDDDAFRVLVERHSRAVFRLAYRLTGNEHDAEDVVQETFLKAYRRLSQFEDRAQFGSWVHRIAANTAYDLLRTRKRRTEDPLTGPEDQERPLVADGLSPERLVLGGQIEQRIGRALTRLSPLERSAFLLRHHEGLSLREIGEALSCDTDSVKQSVCRAVRKLRQVLTPLAASTGLALAGRKGTTT